MPENIVGAKIRKLRYQRGMTQDALAARCGRLGWDVSRGTLAKVEARVRCVSDGELLVLARALRVRVDELYPGSLRRA
jgi:transcriptional regulator with XRE-family HTH domain